MRPARLQQLTTEVYLFSFVSHFTQGITAPRGQLPSHACKLDYCFSRHYDSETLEQLDLFLLDV